MAEEGEVVPAKSGRNRERQPISVPFVWEERPGMPKKDWKPDAARTAKPVAPPVKLVVSVPFGWEEKPGTPLQSFVQQQNQSIFMPPSLNAKIVSSLPGKDEEQRINEGAVSSDSELETCSYETYDSFSSAISTNLFSAQPTSFVLPDEGNIEQLQSPGSPASEAEASLAGASFLEWLFPLLAPSSSNSRKPNFPEMNSVTKLDAQCKELQQENNCSSQIRRPLLTLEELIAMSRRRSCQRKVRKMHRQTSMDFNKGNAFGCCIFGMRNGIPMLPMKWKKQLQLKLM